LKLYFHIADVAEWPRVLDKYGYAIGAAVHQRCELHFCTLFRNYEFQ